MSKKISELPVKSSMVAADGFTILDSQDANLATKNKQVRRDVALAGLQPAAPVGNQLGVSGGWVAAGDSATKNVGTGSGQVAAGNAPAGAVAGHESDYAHANLPTSAEKQAMINASTAPSGANPFVTNADLNAVIGIDEVQDDPAPKLGGNLSLAGHRIMVTDVLDVFHGAIGYSPTVGAMFLSENMPGEYFEDKAGVSFKDGLLSLHGSRAQIKALVGAGNREVWVDPDGGLYPVEPAPPAWDVEDQSTAKVAVFGDSDGVGAWTKITDLKAATAQAISAGDAVGCTTRAYINNLSSVGGDLEFGWGLGAAEPAVGAGTSIVAVVPAQKGYVTANHFQEALANIPAGTEIQAWVRALGTASFGPWIDGLLSPHYLTIEAVGGVTTVPLHASTHAAGQPDAITPAAIGAAPAAQGVTNGNAHDHLGGHGGQIAYTSLSGIPSTFPPAAHAHGNITNAGTVGSAANLPLITGTTGLVVAGAFGTAVNTFCQGNDTRLSNARTPTAHAASHATGQADEITPAAIDAQVAMPTATKAEMESGTDAALRAMSPLTVRQGGDARLVAPPQIGSVTPNMGMFTALRLHNTTDTTVNFERLSLTWMSNTAIIGTTYGGTGVSRNLQLMQGGITRFEFTPYQTNHKIPSSSMLVNYGTEQLTAGGWTAGTGWAEGPTGTFTHSSGTATLAHSVAITNGDRYHCSWTVTGRTAGSFVVAFGGYTSITQNASGAIGHVAVDTATLIITPTTDFNGVVTFSLKRVTGGNYASILWQDTNTNYVNALSFPGGYLGRNIVMGGGGTFITSGDWNSGIGTSALTNLVTGKTNSAFGSGALVALESGNGNAAVGGWALGSLLNGTSNVGFGGNAGRYLVNLSTPATQINNCVFIGSNTSSLAIDSTNQIVIGYLVQGLGSNTTVIGNSSITKTRLQGVVETNNDFESITSGKGVLLRSPNGTRYRISVNDAGAVIATAVP